MLEEARTDMQKKKRRGWIVSDGGDSAGAGQGRDLT